MKIKPSDLTKAMRKSPSLKLWDKTLKSWNEKDRKDFNIILNGKKVFEVKKRKVKDGLKVMRISDNKIYPSVKLCREDNGFYIQQMTDKLKIGTEFKKL